MALDRHPGAPRDVAALQPVALRPLPRVPTTARHNRRWRASGPTRYPTIPRQRCRRASPFALAASSGDDPQTGTREAENRANSILEIALVCKMEKLGVIDEQHDRRGGGT